MKKQLLFMLVGLLLLPTTVSAQQRKEDRYKNGEVLVKFKSNTIEASADNTQQCPRFRKIVSRQNNVNSVMQQLGVNEAKQLMPLSNKKRQSSVQKAASTHSDLSQLYLLRFDSTKASSVEEAIQTLRQLDEVEYAEPNYIVKACSADYTSEPLFNEQWGLQAIRMPELWQVPVKNTRRPIIAILDTGVETTHPDLAANIWQNEDETVDDADSDENGFVDDIRGWNFVDNSANTEDNNGHGTHCAGIAAAIGDNGEGVCGANPDAIIMPVKILDANGVGSFDLIIEGVDYAVANGADIISMSLSSCGIEDEYHVVEEALSMAYDQNKVILAAAGNDNVCMNNDHQEFHGNNECYEGVSPRYPAASKYVLGVMAINESGELASLSNFDCDGPLRARDPLCYDLDFEDNQSYELKVPGENILSTYIHGGYTYLSGTSMACPMAAGAISRLLQCRDYSHEELLKALVHTSKETIDIMAAYQVTAEDLAQTTFIIEHKGVAMTFVKTSEGTCQLGDGEHPAVDISTQGAVFIPEEVHGLSVTSIAINAFKGCEMVTEVTLPFNVTTIWSDALKGCSSLVRLTLTGWTQTCMGEVFDETAYDNCELQVLDRYEEYYRNAEPWKFFAHQETIPYALGRLFLGDVNGEKFPFVVTSVSPKTAKFGCVFYYDMTASNVVIPSETQGYAVTSISENALAGHKDIVSVEIPTTIEHIGRAAFAQCSKLESINIPEGITALSECMFDRCTALTSIQLPSSIEYIGAQAFEESGISSFTFPKKVTTIEHHLFCLCKNLKHIEIPAQIKRIEYDAFHESGLETVVIGEGVEYIGEFAFYECPSLKQIQVKAKTPPFLPDIAFSEYSYSVPLIVPKGCKEVYQSASGWYNFTNISEAEEPESVPGDVNNDGEVDLSDAIMVTYYSLHEVPSNFNAAAADMNGDGDIDLSDAIIIIYISLGVR